MKSYPRRPIARFGFRVSCVGLVISLALNSQLGTRNWLYAAAYPLTPSGAPPAKTTGRLEPMIEVSVDALEISESNTKSVGIDWGQFQQKQGGSQQLDLNAIDSNSVTLLERGAFPSLFTINPFIRNVIAARVNTLVQQGQARVLATPTLLTKSGFEASFLVGGEIPYPTLGQGGGIGVDFKKYGVSLKILPTLTPRQTIEAQITVGVSHPDSGQGIKIQSVDVPALASREAGTKVEVDNGETVVLAGIKQSRKEKIISRIPILGYIPIIGMLFRTKSDRISSNNLLLFVTFKLVK